ncbi:alkaline phosphatase [Candidatus Moduliflexus flocculans]|uniref:Alkaline phosphatase n=1 Tax=Candidatus Moduliflexus flocculans TaxID=1499966 RepID=A0A081BMZ0_9BACT|nr:alkaline phosphatase [Candidatus Moduliflexus flocculans]
MKKLWLFVCVVVMMTLTGAAQAAETKQAKYVMVFIGDGMSIAQRNAAELYLGNTKDPNARPEATKLVMNTFPAQGVNTTYDLTSVIPDSASAGTAISTGFKTASGVIAMDPSAKIPYKTIAEVAKEQGWKVGILTTVSLDHATPAVFYAHQKSRKDMYEISTQLVNSGFDFFAGGQMLKTTKEGQPNILDLAKEKGYTIAMGRAGLETLKPGMEKVIAMNETVDHDAAMYYTLDQTTDQVTIAEYTAKAIELLDNPKGFFMMVEGGKIDWACHANDAASSIQDTLAFDAAVAEGVKFYEQHPEETVIIVTGDHETGGLSIGFAGTAYASYIEKIKQQKMSYLEFNKKLDEFKKANPSAKFEDVLPLIQEGFGMYVIPAEEKAALEKAVADAQAKDASEDVKKAAKDADKKLHFSMALTDLELGVLREAFAASMAGSETGDPYAAGLLYGGYEPLTVKLTTILNQKAGLGWSSYSHTASPVQTSALGVGAELFNGYYDQTDIYKKMMTIAGFEVKTASTK